MLSDRLLSLTKFINKKDLVADIGCDHGLLSIYLVKNKLCKKVIATDINPKALNNAINNIKNNNLVKEIETKLGKGLEPIKDENINTVIISGMGTNTIIHMFENVDKKYKVITQSNNDYYNLRKYFVNKDYKIKAESIVLDNDKYYINIVFIPGIKKYSKKELLYGSFLINDKKNINYFISILNKNKSIYKKIPYKNIVRKIDLKIRIKYLKNIINNLSN